VQGKVPHYDSEVFNKTQRVATKQRTASGAGGNSLSLNKSAISTYENDIRHPSFEILVRLANLYRVSTDYLLGQTNTRSVDLSELTEEEANYICGLVELMSKKNGIINNTRVWRRS